MKILCIYLMAFALFSCSKDDTEVVKEPVKSSVKQITSFVFKANENEAIAEDVTAVIDEQNKTITATVPNGTDINSLTPTLVVSEKAVVDQTGAKDFSSPVNYTVMAEDGTKAVYKTTVTINPSDKKEILVFGFKANENDNLNEDIIGSIDQDAKTINVVLPEDSSLNALIPFIETSSEATISPLGVQDFTDPITYTVTAQDGSTTAYEVIITLTLSSSKQILSFIFKAEDNLSITDDIEGTINEDLKTIEFVYTNGVDLSLLQPTLEVSPKSSINRDGPQNFTNTILYKVTAEDGSITDYKVIGISNLEKQRQVLIAIYNANPNNTLPWNLDDPDITSWRGVSVDENNNIRGLYLLENRDGGEGTYGYSLTTIPEEILQLSFLRILDLGGNVFTDIPPTVLKLNNLTHLYLDFNNITSITNEIGNLENLERLILVANKIKSLPPEIGMLKKLTRLRLNENNLIELPKEIGELVNLEDIDIAGNELTGLPAEFGQLTKITNLNLAFNKFKELPKNMEPFKSLIILDLRYNDLKVIPYEIEQLSNLSSLDLSQNDLITIPKEMGNLINLRTLNLRNNNLNFIPQEVCNLQNTGTSIGIDAGVECK
ncbi:leucine-rich repeat domain-containing protein [Maribacter sp. CXY002]|uniref:leucine-rich repeat domain-containing protein n=1 Tax=Maribacter luteocoastalis TaxID=3407671 RepID=UPI003B68167C